jgi:hypothetical protein
MNVFATLLNAASVALDKGDIDAMVSHCLAVAELRDILKHDGRLEAMADVSASKALHDDETDEAFETRTAAGREAYDARVLAFFTSRRGDVILSERAHTDVGGSRDQFRKSCNRLIEAGSLVKFGKARGTRYCAPGRNTIQPELDESSAVEILRKSAAALDGVDLTLIPA